MADWRVIRAADLVAAPWRNGLGTSRDIATGRGPDGAMRWQVGIADLERDAPFSHYPDYDRIFTPIAGDPPPELAFHGGPWEPCPLLTPKPFPGDVPTLSRIPAPGRAFNAIVDRRHHVAEVSVLRMEPGGTIRTPEAAVVVVHCLSGAPRRRDGPWKPATAWSAAAARSRFRPPWSPSSLPS